MISPSHTLFVFAAIWLVTFSLPLRAQKVEREYSLKPSAVPASIDRFLDSAFTDALRVKFYKDIGEETTTIETKLIYNRRRYSVEFDSLGVWIDTEVEVASEQVPAVVWSQACPLWAKL